MGPNATHGVSEGDGGGVGGLLQQFPWLEKYKQSIPISVTLIGKLTRICYHLGLI